MGAVLPQLQSYMKLLYSHGPYRVNVRSSKLSIGTEYLYIKDALIFFTGGRWGLQYNSEPGHL